MSRIVPVPYAVERDEDGVWCASAQIRPGVGAVGDGVTPEEAVADLRAALTTLIDEIGVLSIQGGTCPRERCGTS